ncbi:MAG TPA: hypothetical protein VEQ61_02585 [Thermoleophilaceae bacterium]|nr:hypothetical protein [Thermoleophilaceae bacterium]
MRVPAAQLRSLRRREPHTPGAARVGARNTAASAAARAPSAPIWPAILACLAIAALTLLLPSTPTYDPWAWIMWGREIIHLDLETTGGPSWKPLPILFTIPFAVFGDDVAPYLGLVVARAGGLFACVMAYRMANRLIGRGPYGVLAGVGAALALFSSFKFVRDAALGNSEALLAAIALWAFERHLDGRHDHALLLGFAGALLRPEVWPFLALYGLWLWVREPALRLRMVVLAALIPALWFLPEWWGAGDPFRAGARANQPNPGSAAFAEHPALDVISRFRKVVIAPVKVGIVIAIVYALVMWLRRRGERVTLALAAGGIAWLVLVAAMTEAGFAGNQRYLIVTTAAACVLGGIGAARVLQGVEVLARRLTGSRRAGAAITATAFVLALAISAPFISEKANNTSRVSGGLEHEAEIWHDLKGLIDEVGGRERLLACGGVFSGPFQTQVVAYELHIHGIQVGWRETPPPGVALRTRTVPDGPLVVKPSDDRFRYVARHGKWRMLTVPPEGGAKGCPAASPDAPRAPRPPDA